MLFSRRWHWEFPLISIAADGLVPSTALAHKSIDCLVVEPLSSAFSNKWLLFIKTIKYPLKVLQGILLTIATELGVVSR